MKGRAVKTFKEWSLLEGRFDFDDSNPRMLQHGYDPEEGWKEDLIGILQSDNYLIDKSRFLELFVDDLDDPHPLQKNEIREAEEAWDAISKLFSGAPVRMLNSEDGVSFDGIYKTFKYSRGIKGPDISHNAYQWHPRMLDLGDGTSIMWISLGMSSGSGGISLALISDDSVDNLINAINSRSL